MASNQDNSQPYVPARSTEVMHEIQMPVVLHHHDGEIGPQGPQGEPGHMGPQGPIGPIGEAGRKYTTTISTSPQRVKHDLGRYPSSVVVMDAEGNQVLAQISYVDENNIDVAWNGDLTGTIIVYE